MEKVKIFLAVSPAVALVIGITFLQGYWGYFNIIIFPYLTFNEMLAYSAIPMFGYLVATAVGWLMGAPLVSREAIRRPTNVFDIVMLVLVTALFVTTIYFNNPFKWLFGPVISVLTILVLVLRIKSAHDLIRSNRPMFVAGAVMTFLVIGVFCWGRMEAQTLHDSSESNVAAFLDGKLVETKIIGKANSYYFFLNAEGDVEQYPQQLVGKITYLRRSKK